MPLSDLEGPEFAELRAIRATGEETLKLLQTQQIAMSNLVNRVIQVEGTVHDHGNQIRHVEDRLDLVEAKSRRPWRWLPAIAAGLLFAMTAGLVVAVALAAKL